jgi:hypothetical protein
VAASPSNFLEPGVLEDPADVVAGEDAELTQPRPRRG